MKQILTTSVIFSLLSFGFLSVAIASPRNLPEVNTMLLSQGNSCQNALASVKRKIQENRDIPVSFKLDNIPNHYKQKGRPPRGQKILDIIMGGIKRKGNRYKIENVMNSPQLLSTLAVEVINACNDISAVNFGVGNAHETRFYGLVGDRVQEFKCVSRHPRYGVKSITWGSMYCL